MHLLATVAILAGLVLTQDTGSDPRNPSATHIIFVPFSKLETIGIRDDQQVVLSAAEYKRLRQQAALARTLLQGLKPHEALLKKATYRGRLQDGQLRLSATLDFEALADGWNRFRFSLGNGAVTALQTDGQQALLRVVDGQYELLIRGAGTAQLELELTYPVELEPSRQRLLLSLPPAAIASLELVLPGRNYAIRLKPVVVHDVQEQDAATRLRADVGGRQSLEVTWQTKTTPDLKDLLATAYVTALAQVDTTSIQLNTTADIRIVRGALDTVRFSLPTGQRVLEVRGDLVKGWAVEEADGNRVLRIELFRPVAESLRLQIRTDASIRGDVISLKVPAPVDIARVSGVVAVQATADMIVIPEQTQGAVQVPPGDHEQLPTDALHFRFYTPDFSLALAIDSAKPWIRTRMVTDFIIRRTHVEARWNAQYHIQQAGVFRLPIALPQGFELDSVSCDRMQRYDVRSTDAGLELHLVFTERVKGELSVQVSGTLPLDQPLGPEPSAVSLVPPKPLAVDKWLHVVRIIAPDGVDATLEQPGADPLHELAQEQGLIVRAIPSGYRIAGTVRLKRADPAVKVLLRRRPARVTAIVTTTIAIHPQTATVTSTVRYRVDYSPTARFILRLPAALAEKAHLRAVGHPELRQVHRTEDEDRPGWTRFVLEPQQEVLGDYVLRVQYDLPLAATPDGGTAVEPPEPVAVERVEGEIGLSKEPTLAVQASAGGAEAIDPRELKHLQSHQPIHLAFRYFSQPVLLRIAASRPPIQPVAETIVTTMLTECAVPSEGRLKLRALLLLRTSQRQRLAFRLHRSARILSATVDGKMVVPEVGEDGQDEADRRLYYIDISGREEVDAPLAMVITYELDRDARLGLFGELTLHFPELTEHASVGEQYVVCWLPRRWQPLSVSNMEDVTTWADYASIVPVRPAALPPEIEALRTHLDGWLAGGPRLHQFAVYRTFVFRPRATLQYVSWPAAFALLSGGIFVLAVILLRSPIEWRLTLVVATALALLGVNFARAEYAFLATQAAAPGAAFAVALWTVVGLRNACRRLQLGTRAAGSTRPANASPNEHVATSPDTGTSENDAQGV